MDKAEFKDSAVWQLVVQHLHNYRLELMDDLRNCSLGDVERIRGRMDGIDWLEALPETLFRGAANDAERRNLQKI